MHTFFVTIQLETVPQQQSRSDSVPGTSSALHQKFGEYPAFSCTSELVSFRPVGGSVTAIPSDLSNFWARGKHDQHYVSERRYLPWADSCRVLELGFHTRGGRGPGVPFGVVYSAFLDFRYFYDFGGAIADFSMHQTNHKHSMDV